MTARNLLHRNKLEAFAAWCAEQGHTVQRNMASFEVLRVRLAGVAVPVLIYDRCSGDHLTLQANGEKLVRRWLKARGIGRGVVAPPSESAVPAISDSARAASR